MAIVKERVVEEIAEDRELIQVRDTVKLIDSPLDKLKKSSKGRVTAIHGDLVADPHALMSVQFKCGGKRLTLMADANRFRFTKHAKGEDLPDALNETPNLEDVDGEA